MFVLIFRRVGYFFLSRTYSDMLLFSISLPGLPGFPSFSVFLFILEMMRLLVQEMFVIEVISLLF